MSSNNKPTEPSSRKLTSDNKSNEFTIWLEGIEYELGAVKYFLKRNQITKSVERAHYCCEYADEMLDIIGRK